MNALRTKTFIIVSCPTRSHAYYRYVLIDRNASLVSDPNPYQAHTRSLSPIASMCVGGGTSLELIAWSLPTSPWVQLSLNFRLAFFEPSSFLAFPPLFVFYSIAKSGWRAKISDKKYVAGAGCTSILPENKKTAKKSWKGTKSLRRHRERFYLSFLPSFSFPFSTTAFFSLVLGRQSQEINLFASSSPMKERCLLLNHKKRVIAVLILARHSTMHELLRMPTYHWGKFLPVFKKVLS